MMALILAAGYGTRLYPLALNTPKALLPVKGKPILGHLMDKLVVPGLGIREILLVSNHRYPEQFQRWSSPLGLKIPLTVLDDGSTSEENRLGSVGDLAFAIRSRSLKDDLLILGSDNLLQNGLEDFMAFARQKSPGVTLGAYELPDRALASRYGVLKVNEQNRITEIEEKPPKPTSSLISTAVYFFHRSTGNLVLEYVNSTATADTLGSFIHWLIARNSVFAYRFRGPWFDIGDLASYKQAEESFSP